jgi:hypothetical protein
MQMLKTDNVKKIPKFLIGCVEANKLGVGTGYDMRGLPRPVPSRPTMMYVRGVSTSSRRISKVRLGPRGQPIWSC